MSAGFQITGSENVLHSGHPFPDVARKDLSHPSRTELRKVPVGGQRGDNAASSAT